MTEAPNSRSPAAPPASAPDLPSGYEELLTNVIANLHKHGYPKQRVSLPLERMYEVAYAKGLNFNKALELLKARGIDHEKATTKIVFFPLADAAEAAGGLADFFGKLVPDGLTNAATDALPGGMAEMMAKASAMLQGMAPEQLAQLQRMVAGMSDEERQAMVDKAKAMGLGT